MGGNGHIDGQEHHEAPHDLGEPVHEGSGTFIQEDEHSNHRADESPGHRGHPQQHIEPQARAPYIADVEGQAPGHHQSRYEIPQPGQEGVGNILAGLFGRRNDPPHIQLSNGVDQDGGQDHKTEAGPQLAGEHGGLGQEPRSDGRGGHQEGRPQQYTPVGFFHDGLFLQSLSFNSVNSDTKKSNC